MNGIWNSLLRTAAVIAALAGLSMLLASQASAQINIEGLIRGAMAHGGGHYRSHRGRVHESKRERHRGNRKDDDEDEQSAKEEHTHGSNKTELSAPVKEAPQTAAASPPPSAPAPAASASTPKSSGEVPTFTPER